MVHFRRKIKGSLRGTIAGVCLLLVMACGAESEVGKSDRQGSGASIEGFVREQGTDVAIAGAAVFVVSPSDRNQMHATTDSTGHFVLAGLEAGRHLIAVVREGYVLPRQRNIAGYPYQVDSGERLTDVVFYLIPAGTIGGRVFKGDGKPANRVEVQLLQRVYLMGQPQWTVVDRGGSSQNVPVWTNERGEFRATGVVPGEYHLRLVSRELTVESVTPGAVSLTPLFSEAVEVKSGRETLLKDVQMKDGRRGWIRHLVVNESGEPLDGLGTWEVRPPGWIGAGYPLAEKRVVNQYHETQPDSPGTYDIIATWSRPGGLLAAMTRVEFRGADMAGKMIVRKPEGKLTGSVVLQDAEGKKSPVAGAEVAIGPKISYFARSGAGGELPFPAMYQGRYQLGYVRGIPADSFVMSVKQGGRDVLRDEVVVGKESAAVEVVVSAGAGVVAGKVTDASGGVVHNALVALVPMGALRERKDYYGAFRDTRTDQKGMFEIRGVAPGEYQAYAWSDAPASAFRNEEFVKGFAGTKVIVGSGASVKLELRALP